MPSELPPWLEQALSDLAAVRIRAEDRFARVEAHSARLEVHITLLAAAQVKSDQRLSRVEQQLCKVEERLTRVEEHLEALAAAQVASEQRLARVEERLTEARTRVRAGRTRRGPGGRWPARAHRPRRAPIRRSMGCCRGRALDPVPVIAACHICRRCSPSAR
jgi:DNA repair exonuclease SbcCD ATPase subunit